MAYRQDPDLEFLANVPSADLEALVRILTEDGKRLTEELTTHERYKESSPDHHEYWDLIAAEIQCFGTNTLATLFRGGKGVLYREVLIDVCDKMKVNFHRGASVETIELNLLMKVLTDSMKEMGPEELEAVCDDLKLSPMRYTPEAVTIALQLAISLGVFAPYRIAPIVANAVVTALIGRGLALGASAALGRLMSVFAGPIGWTLSAAWLLVDIAGPAYRVTVPAVIMVAYLRAESAKRAMQEQKRRQKERKRLKKRMKKLEKRKRSNPDRDHSSSEQPEE